METKPKYSKIKMAYDSSFLKDSTNRINNHVLIFGRTSTDFFIMRNEGMQFQALLRLEVQGGAKQKRNTAAVLCSYFPSP